MKIAIKKRVELIEKQVNAQRNNSPDLIIISYDDTKKQYKATEHYKKAKILSYYLPSYKEYIFRPECNCTVLLDLLSDPNTQDGNFYNFHTKEILKELPKGSGFTLELEEERSFKDNVFIITPCQYK